MAKENGGLIVSAGINKIDTSYYWHIYVQTTDTQNDTQATINADQWYCIELYFNATTNGCAKLWIDDVLMCELTGDFSGAGDIERVYPYIYIVGNQSSAKTVYHDNYCVDYEKIGSGTSTIFSGAVFYEGGE